MGRCWAAVKNPIDLDRAHGPLHMQQVQRPTGGGSQRLPDARDRTETFTLPNR
jgi:hypothetical protein